MLSGIFTDDLLDKFCNGKAGRAAPVGFNFSERHQHKEPLIHPGMRKREPVSRSYLTLIGEPDPNRAFAVHCVRPQAERGHEHIQCAAKASEVPRANNSCPLLPRHSRSPVRRNPPGMCCKAREPQMSNAFALLKCFGRSGQCCLRGDRDSRQD